LLLAKYFGVEVAPRPGEPGFVRASLPIPTVSFRAREATE
jgi:hypothetical protein